MPEGALRAGAFVLASTSLLTTLAINASPFMRFDGYFAVSDALDMPNLHARSFALARWKLREWLFALDEPPPEYFSKGKTAALIAFAVGTWIYRLVLFLGIAALVYFFFFKLLGLILFAVEIIWFVALPIISEVRAWVGRWDSIRRSRRSLTTALVTGLLLVLTVVPLPGRVSASAMLRPTDVWPVFAPSGSRIDALPFAEGARVREGDVVLTLHVPDLALRRTSLEARVSNQRVASAAAGFDADTRKRLLVQAENLATSEAELAGVDAELLSAQPRAPFSGRLRDLNPDLRVGEWVERKEKIALLVRDDGRWLVETWLDEDAVTRVKPGQQASFVTNARSGGPLSLKVTSVAPDATRVLPRPELAAQAGGHILTREKNGQLVPERAIYRVTLEPENIPQALAAQSWRGQIVIQSEWAPLADRYLRAALGVVLREAGF